jgi:hypothetical protein
MGTANAFDMLILPMFQCTAGIFATFALIRLFQVTLGFFLASLQFSEAEPFSPRPRITHPYRPASPRADPAHARALSQR